MEERARRIGMNEALFREVNDRIDAVADGFGLTAQLDIVCECGDARCTERIAISRDDYSGLRDDRALFAVFPGHEAPDVETVVDKRDGYDVVRKHEGDPLAVAEATDPRS